MSIHKHTRDLRWGLTGSTYLYSPLLFDPIFTPIFTAVFGAATLGSTGITLASIGTAIATTSLTSGVTIQ